VRAAIPICLFVAITPAMARARDTLDAVEASLRSCIDSRGPARLTMPAPPFQSPRGLTRGKSVRVTPIDGARGKAFAYEGMAPNEVFCGVAVYGKVDRRFVSKVVEIIEGYSPSYVRDPEPHYKFSNSTALETYWGDPRARSLYGIALLQRPPYLSAPTLEVDFHSANVR
jgi:hypothetical protein